MAFVCQIMGRRTSSDGRIGVAWGTACGARRLKCWKSKWDKASATELSIPALWEAVKANEWRAAIRERWRRRTIMFGSFEVPECNMLTTAMLSCAFCGNFSIRFVVQQWSHKWDATTTRNSSLYMIDNGCCVEDHSPINHSLSKMVPYPRAPAVSEETCTKLW